MQNIYCGLLRLFIKDKAAGMKMHITTASCFIQHVHGNGGIHFHHPEASVTTDFKHCYSYFENKAKPYPLPLDHLYTHTETIFRTLPKLESTGDWST